MDWLDKVKDEVKNYFSSFGPPQERSLATAPVTSTSRGPSPAPAPTGRRMRSTQMPSEFAIQQPGMAHPLDQFNILGVPYGLPQPPETSAALKPFGIDARNLPSSPSTNEAVLPPMKPSTTGFKKTALEELQPPPIPDSNPVLAENNGMPLASETFKDRAKSFLGSLLETLHAGSMAASGDKRDPHTAWLERTEYQNPDSATSENYRNFFNQNYVSQIPDGKGGFITKPIYDPAAISGMSARELMDLEKTMDKRAYNDYLYANMWNKNYMDNRELESRELIARMKKTGGGGQPKLKELSQTEVENLAGSDAAMMGLREARQMLDEGLVDDSVGPYEGRWNDLKGKLGFEHGASRYNAMINALKTAIQYAEGGKQLSDKEIAAFGYQMPSISDNPEVQREKFKALERKIVNRNNSRIQALRSAGRDVRQFREMSDMSDYVLMGYDAEGQSERQYVPPEAVKDFAAAGWKRIGK